MRAVRPQPRRHTRLYHNTSLRLAPPSFSRCGRQTKAVNNQRRTLTFSSANSTSSSPSSFSSSSFPCSSPLVLSYSPCSSHLDLLLLLLLPLVLSPGPPPPPTWTSSPCSSCSSHLDLLHAQQHALQGGRPQPAPGLPVRLARPRGPLRLVQQLLQVLRAHLLLAPHRLPGERRRRRTQKQQEGRKKNA